MDGSVSSIFMSGRRGFPTRAVPNGDTRGAVNPDLDSRLERLASLGEPVRRALYRYVVGEPAPVSRERAAAGVGVPHHVAKFNLDRLVEDGLLEAEYGRPAGRAGPGAGRPAKLYRRAPAGIEVSLPERRYDLAGRLLTRAVARAARTAKPVVDTLAVVAHEAGRQLGAEGAAPGGRRRGQRHVTEAVVQTLVDHGFEPSRDADGITLANCPFDTLARDETELVCGMNLSLIRGVLDGAGATAMTAELDPAPGRCCVRIRQR